MRTVKILAIDGGGVRGLIPALILAEVEKRCGRPLSRIFDVVSGTSNGAVLACLFTKPDPIPGTGLVEIYAHHCKAFFERSALRRVLSLDGWLRPKYAASGVDGSLKRHIGETAELKDAVTELVIPTYDLRGRAPRAMLFSRRAARASPDENFRMWEVARASCAAPGYFPGPVITSLSGRRVIHAVDGGVYVNDPALQALCHAISLEEDKDSLADGRVSHLLLSLGTGFHDEPILPRRARNWGMLGWAPRISGVMFEGQTDLVSRQVAELLPASPSLRRQWRLQVHLPRPYALDDVSPGGLAFLEETTRRFIEGRSAEIDGMCRELLAP
jgi:hypothetical protein